MIRSLLFIALCLATGPALAEEPAEDSPLERYRSPLDVLNERMVGTASRAVRFDWRKSKVGLGVVGSSLLELNNFHSARAGLSARTPFGPVMGEVALTRVFSWGSDSTDKLALTPYRQFGRPSRFELDVNVGYPLAEGVATVRPGFFPATELVFSAMGGFRYLYYWGQHTGHNLGDVAQTVLAPRLTDRELNNLEGDRSPGMQIDPNRYNLLAGLSLDVYFQSGGFITPRAMIAVPLFSAATGSGLGFWWELSLTAGWAF